MAELPEKFDLEALLAPIPGDTPVGIDLREDASPNSIYYRLRDARAEARAAERAAETPDDDNPGRGAATAAPLWVTVRDLATEAIASQSKDLEIAAWLTEALLRTDGLVGVTAGFLLMHGLVEAFWDDLLPLPDEDGIEARVRPVAGLNGVSGDGTLIQPLRQITLFDRPDGTPLQLWRYEQSADLATIADPEHRQQRIAAGAIEFDTLTAEANAQSGEVFTVLRRQASEAEEAWRALGEALDQRAGADAPPTSRLREVLQKFGSVARLFGAAAGDALEVGTASTADAPAAGDLALPATTAATAAAATAVNSREDALRALAAIAEYFRRSEPHSPLSYTLQEAVRRARMTWPQLLEEIVPDESSRAAILTTLGIKPAPPS